MAEMGAIEYFMVGVLAVNVVIGLSWYFTYRDYKSTEKYHTPSEAPPEYPEYKNKTK